MDNQRSSAVVPGRRPVLLYVIKFTALGGAPLHLLRLIQHFQDHYEVHLAVGEIAHVAHAARKLGVRVHHIPQMEKDASPLQLPRLVRILRQLIREHEVDLIHAHSPLSGVSARIAARLERRSCVTTIHGWNFAPGLRRRRRLASWLLEFFAARMGQPLIMVSQFDLDLARRLGVGRVGQMTLIHNGIDDYCAPPDLDGHEPAALIMVARFEEQKAQEQLLQACARLHGQWTLTFVGGGSRLPSCKALAEDLGVAGQVKFTGDLEDPERLLKRSGIAVLVSHYEGLPIAILEAMREGLPVVASRVGGVAEEVVDEETGFLVDPGDVAQLAGRLQALLDDPNRARQMGLAGRQRFLSGFSSQAMLDKTAEVYAQLLEN